jgi:hypothetical protein
MIETNMLNQIHMVCQKNLHLLSHMLFYLVDHVLSHALNHYCHGLMNYNWSPHPIVL